MFGFAQVIARLVERQERAAIAAEYRLLADVLARVQEGKAFGDSPDTPIPFAVRISPSVIFETSDDALPAASIAFDVVESYGQQTEVGDQVYERGKGPGQHAEEYPDVSDQVAHYRTS